MSKVKAPKTKGIPNKHLHARTTFLCQAATYLTLHTATDDAPTTQSAEKSTRTRSPLALQLGSDLQQVSRKGQLRLSIDLKRSMCKSCNTILIPGRTASQVIENLSKGGKKPWADVLLIECQLCGSKKRFPIGATRQLSKSERKNGPVDTASVAVPEEPRVSGPAPPSGIEHNSNAG